MFVRVSLTIPKEGHRQEVIDIENDLLGFFSSQPGYVDGYRLLNEEHIGRVTIWESEAAAEHVAQSERTLARRARLMEIIEPASIETAFEGVHVMRA